MNDFIVTVFHLTNRFDLSDSENDHSYAIQRRLSASLNNFNFAEVLPTLEPNPHSVFIELESAEARHVQLYKQKGAHSVIPERCIRFIFKFTREEFDNRCVQHQNKHSFTPSSARASTSRYFSSMCNSYANRLAILINLSAPGFCDSWMCVNETSDMFSEQGTRIGSSMDEIYYEKKFLSGKRLSFYNPAKIIKWSVGLKGFWIGLPETNIERAVCYFSYLFVEDRMTDHHLTAIWAYSALEAIFSDTSSAVVEKMRKRVQSIMRSAGFPANIKAINDLYNDRSRVLHGNTRFAANFSDPYDNESGSMYHRGVYQSLSTAILVLVTTFRYACERNAAELIFKEQIVPIRGKST